MGAALECAFAGRRSVALSFAYFEALSGYGSEVVECACEVAVDVVLSLLASGVRVWSCAMSMCR